MKTETDNSIHRIRALEAKRTERGYKPGWLYYECKKAGLLETYQKLKKQGLSQAYEAKHLTLPNTIWHRPKNFSKSVMI
jgi:hypothetical protein